MNSEIETLSNNTYSYMVVFVNKTRVNRWLSDLCGADSCYNIRGVTVHSAVRDS